jgi:hypothetical protein
METSRHYALINLAALPLVIGCGGSPPPPQAPTGGASSGPVVVTPPATTDLSQVSDPPGLVVSGRVAKLSASFEVVHAWSKLPMPGAEQVTELLTSEAVGGLADLDQPIDFAVAISGKLPKVDVLSAVSAAVKDPEKAKASLSERYKLVPGSNGVVLIQGLGRPAKNDSDEDDDDGKADRKPAGDPERTCELAPAFGTAPTRIICGWSPKALGALGPWLTRTATRLPSSSDVHVEVRLEPLKEGVDMASSFLNGMAADALSGKNQVPGANEAFSAVLKDLGSFARDLSTIALDLQLSEPGAALSGTIKLGGATSQIAHFMTEHPERNGPPPDVFWQLPGDADQAAFTRGFDDADAKNLMALAQPLFTAMFQEVGVKEADRKPILDALQTLASGGAWVYASGIDAEAARKALAALAPLAARGDDAAALDAKHTAAESLLGWHVMEHDAPLGQVIGAIKGLATAWSKPGFVAAIRAKHSDVPLPTVRSAPMPKAVVLPAGSVHYVIELPTDSKLGATGLVVDKPKPGAKTPKPKPLVIHMLVVPDGQRTWLGLGGDETTCASRLAISLASSGNKLEGRADLGALKQNRNVGSAGFYTIRGFGEGLGVATLFSGVSSSEVVSAYESSLQLPHQALTPIPFSVTPQAGSPGALVSTFTLPKGAIEDIVTTIVKHGGF